MSPASIENNRRAIFVTLRPYEYAIFDNRCIAFLLQEKVIGRYQTLEYELLICYI